MISAVIEQGRSGFAVYDEKGRKVYYMTWSGAELVGFTSASFTIRNGSTFRTYDEKGHLLHFIIKGSSGKK